jgi:hypothetical protein
MNVKGVEGDPPGLVTVTVQLPPSLALLKVTSVSWPELTKVVLFPE